MKRAVPELTGQRQFLQGSTQFRVVQGAQPRLLRCPRRVWKYWGDCGTETNSVSTMRRRQPSAGFLWTERTARPYSSWHSSWWLGGCGEEEAWAQKPMEQLTEGQQKEQRFPLHLNANLITKRRESPIEKQKIFIYSIMVKRKPFKWGDTEIPYLKSKVEYFILRFEVAAYN